MLAARNEILFILLPRKRAPVQIKRDSRKISLSRADTGRISSARNKYRENTFTRFEQPFSGSGNIAATYAASD
jgi:hypothetical protein